MKCVVINEPWLIFYPLLQRELARQTYEGLCATADYLAKGGFPQLRTLLCMGGIDMREQQHALSK